MELQRQTVCEHVHEHQHESPLDLLLAKPHNIHNIECKNPLAESPDALRQELEALQKGLAVQIEIELQGLCENCRRPECSRSHKARIKATSFLTGQTVVH